MNYILFISFLYYYVFRMSHSHLSNPTHPSLLELKQLVQQQQQHRDTALRQQHVTQSSQLINATDSFMRLPEASSTNIANNNAYVTSLHHEKQQQEQQQQPHAIQSMYPALSRRLSDHAQHLQQSLAVNTR
jgi:hypothetical protein